MNDYTQLVLFLSIFFLLIAATRLLIRFEVLCDRAKLIEEKVEWLVGDELEE